MMLKFVSSLSGLLIVPFLAVAAPINDNFADRIQIADWTTISTSTNTVIEAIRTGSNVGATAELGEPPVPNFPARQGSSIWWSWVAPAGGLATLTVEGTGIKPAAGVFSGSALTNLVAAAAPLVSGSTNIVIGFNVTNGIEYHFMVDGAINQTEGNFTLKLRHTQAAPNDDFTNAFVLSGSSATVTGTLAYATSEVGEPFPTGYTGTAPSPSVWWKWTAPTNGPVNMRVDRHPKLGGSPISGFYYPGIATYTGDSLTALTPMATNRVGFDGSSISFKASAGVTYHVSVNLSGIPFGSSDSFLLSLNHAPFFSLTPQLLGDGQLAVSLTGEPNRTYSIDASTNLVTRFSVGTAAATNEFQLIDSTTNWPHRFYRGRANP